MLNNNSNRFIVTALIASILVMTSVDAKAYIDPGSSSYFFQLLIAGLTAFVYFFSSIKRRVLGLFRKEVPQPGPEKETEAQTPQQQPVAQSESRSSK